MTHSILTVFYSIYILFTVVFSVFGMSFFKILTLLKSAYHSVHFLCLLIILLLLRMQCSSFLGSDLFVLMLQFTFDLLLNRRHKVIVERRSPMFSFCDTAQTFYRNQEFIDNDPAKFEYNNVLSKKSEQKKNL